MSSGTGTPTSPPSGRQAGPALPTAPGPALLAASGLALLAVSGLALLAVPGPALPTVPGQALPTVPGRTLPAVPDTVAVGATVAGARQRVDESRRAAPGVAVEVVNPTGSVRVIGWDRREVRVTGELGPEARRLRFEGDGDDLEIEVVPGTGAERHELDPSDLVIRVPAGGSVEVRTLVADVEVSGMRGEVDIESASGDVTVSGEPRELQVVSTGGDVRVRSGSGAREVSVDTASGDVILEVAAGDVSATTLSGLLRVRADGLLAGSFESTSGNIEYSGAVAPGSSLDFENFSGNVEIAVDDDVSARFEVSSYSGAIDNDFGSEARSPGRHASKTGLEFTVGDGSAKISVETFSGNVLIRRRRGPSGAAAGGAGPR